MAKLIKKVRGTEDVLPKDSYRWQFVEDIMRKESKAYGYKEIRTPVFEHTELFQRGVGERIQTGFRFRNGADGLVEGAGIADLPCDVAVHRHVFLVGGQCFGFGNVIQKNGVGEAHDLIHEGDLEIQSRLAPDRLDLIETHHTGVLVLRYHISGAECENGQKYNDSQNDKPTLFHHFVPPSFTKLSKGRSISVPPSPAVLMYSFTPGRASVRAS